MKLRLFLALDLTPGLISKIGHLEEKIEKTLGFKINWIPLKNLHLTLLFLGHLNYEDYLKIIEILDELPPVKGFDLMIRKIAFGPPGKKNMIWLYLEKNKNLEDLKNYFEEKLEAEKIFYKKEERRYLPHINLIRLRDVKIDKEIEEDLGWRVKLYQLSLYESKLKKSGAEYEKLKTVNLML